jgi:hypothetical protein
MQSVHHSEPIGATKICETRLSHTFYTICYLAAVFSFETNIVILFTCISYLISTLFLLNGENC